MRIHNILEDIVIDKIDEIILEFKDKKIRKDLKTAAQHKLDVACYVLNRINPIYVVSGRGLAYLDADYIKKLQRDADLVTLIHQGIERVVNVKRPEYKEKHKKQHYKRGQFFNFPIIRGRIFNSLNFEPVYGIKIKLYYNNKLTKMIEPNWQNPYPIVKYTAGTYLFWPHPLEAEKKGQHKKFEFEIVVDTKDYEKINHYLQIAIEADDTLIDYFRVNNVHIIKDLYLVPK